MLPHPPGVSCNVFILHGLGVILVDRFDSIEVRGTWGIGEVKKQRGAESMFGRGAEVGNARDIAHSIVKKFYCQYVSFRYSVRTVIEV
jgi:hypothetical protein